MLAQNFKTPADLQLSDVEFEALLKVLHALERDEMRHASGASVPNGFNMGNHRVEFSCGTVACIAGWAEIYARPNVINLINDHHHNKSLWQLFRGGDKPCSVTPDQAAIALRNYLTHGEPRWEEALA